MKKALITCADRITPDALRFLEKNFELSKARCALSEHELVEYARDKYLLIMGGDEKVTVRVHETNPGLVKIFLGVDPNFAFDPGVLDHDRKQGILFMAEGGLAAVAVTTFEEMTDPLLFKSRLAKSFLPITEKISDALSIQSVSVIGAGRIGSLVLEKLAGRCRELTYYNPRGKKAELDKSGAAFTGDLGSAFAHDIVTIHLAYISGETEGLIGYGELARIRPNGLLINNARSQLIRPEDLLRFLRERPDVHYVCDVFYLEGRELQELMSSGSGLLHELFRLPNLFYTRHLAAMRPETYEEYSDNLIRIIKNNLD